MDWKTFRQLPHIKLLKEQQQQRFYDLHLQELEQDQYNHWVKGQQDDESFLLQENGFYLLQEDGFRIKLP